MDLYHRRVFTICLGFVPILQDAEDLTQDVYIEVYRSIGNFRGEAQLSTWLHRIAITKSQELLRSRSRQKRSAFFKSLLGLDDDQVFQINDQYNHPGVQVENKEESQILYAAIEKLPEKQKTAFLLHKVEELPQAEMSVQYRVYQDL